MVLKCWDCMMLLWISGLFSRVGKLVRWDFVFSLVVVL